MDRGRMTLVLAAFLAGIAVSVSGLHLIVLPNATSFKEGDDISFTCVHTNLRTHEKIRFIKSMAYGLPPCNGQSCLIAENDRVGPQYMSTGRYNVEGDSGDTGFTLEISDLSGVDSGTIGCRIESVREEEVHEFFVYREIQQMNFKQRLNNGTFVTLKNGGTVSKTQVGTNLDISCLTNDSNTEPQFIMYISEDEDPDYLVTDAFTPGEQSGHSLSKTSGGLNSDHFFQNITTIGTQKLIMESFYHKRYLYCAAHIDEYESKKIYVKLDVLFPPEVSSCQNGTVDEYGAADVMLSCTLYTNPSAANITWRFPWGEVSSASGPSELFNDNYTLVVEEYDEKSNTLKTSITLTKAEQGIFDKPFELTANNDYGEMTTEVFVVLGGAGGMLSSLMVILCGLLMSVVTLL